MVRFESEGFQPPRHGLILLQALILLLFVIFALRFWFLQVHKGEEYDRLARENKMRRESIYAPRGLLRDRHGTLLAVNEPAYALAIIREDCTDIDATLEQVSLWTGTPLEEIRKRYEKNRRRVKSFRPMVLVSDLSYDLLARIESNALFWPGLEIVVRPRRHYLQGPAMAHILGYVADANEAELEADSTLDLGDNVGKSGLELILEPRLRGVKGQKLLEVDVTGRKLNERVKEKPIAGESIDLSIDIDLQAYCMKLYEGKAGGVVVLDPFSGQVLALVTSPSYDNNLFTAGISSAKWKELRENPRKPLLNRVIQSTYPPGSVWKLLVAACAMEYGVIEPHETVYCSGKYRIGRRVFRCWKDYGHGKVDMERALVESCDVYFYALGERLGVDRMSEFAFRSGFGEHTGIDLPHEKRGLVPTREWKRRRYNEAWQGGENLNLAIGQGATLVHPLQVARFIASLLNGGKLLKPSLLRDVEPVVQGESPIGKDMRRLILQAMEATVSGSRGTARRLRRKDAFMGGKTGTAQVVKLKGERRRKTYEMPYNHRDHAWIGTWGVRKDRGFVVVALVENGGHGGSAAGPIVKDIYEYLFSEKMPDGGEVPPGLDMFGFDADKTAGRK